MLNKLLLSLVILMYLCSCSEIIEIENISNRQVNILAPVNASILSGTTVIFSWDSLEGAEKYKLQVATPNFQNATQVVADTTVTVTSLSRILSVGDFSWRVRAENSTYQTVYSTQQSFTVEN